MEDAMNQDLGGLWWAVIDIVFVALLGVAIASANVARSRRDGSIGIAGEAVEPAPDVRATGRWGRWQDILIMLLAAWLCVSPVALPDEVRPPISANAILVGVVLAGIALAAVYHLDSPHEWAIVVGGAWIVASPWILGFSDAPRAAWNHWIVGLLIVALAGWELLALRHMPPLASDSSQTQRRSRLPG
jgi:hypothetical protein